MVKHCPEPWRAELVGKTYFRAPYHEDYMILDSEGVCVGIVWGGAPWPEGERSKDRIVACVNGCSGLADPSAVGELVEALRGALAYDDAVTAEHASQSQLDALDPHWQEKARSALAKLESTP